MAGYYILFGSRSVVLFKGEPRSTSSIHLPPPGSGRQAGSTETLCLLLLTSHVAHCVSFHSFFSSVSVFRHSFSVLCGVLFYKTRCELTTVDYNLLQKDVIIICIDVIDFFEGMI